MFAAKHALRSQQNLYKSSSCISPLAKTTVIQWLVIPCTCQKKNIILFALCNFMEACDDLSALTGRVIICYIIRSLPTPFVLKPHAV
ncbi:hypothetical protein FKM82_010705 [Ascaphus truei]